MLALEQFICRSSWICLGMLFCAGFQEIHAQTTSNLSSRIPAAALMDLAQPQKRLPFREVIQATTRHQVLDFDTNNPAHVEVRAKILLAADLAGERARNEGISASRANEAGNGMESFVKVALKEAGLDARTPHLSTGESRSAGYPDLEITGSVPVYIELKTYNSTTADSTQRTFYYSPSGQSKVTRDALHLLLAFQLEKVERGGGTVFVPVRWKLITLQNLMVNLKFEFNQSNRGLYGSDNGEACLGEGTLK